MDGPMSACERGCWIDAEGSIKTAAPPKSHYTIVVNQSEREPLDDFCAGSLQDGIRCVVTVRKDRRSRFGRRAEYTALITGVENVTKTIKLAGESLGRTQTKRKQIRRFIENLSAPRKRTRREITQAREIMGIT